MVNLNNILSNLLLSILLIIFIYELFTNKKCKKENMTVPEENPWPKGCPRSQRNIAITQSEKIDKLTGRFNAIQNNLDLLKEKHKNIVESNNTHQKAIKNGQKEVNKETDKTLEKQKLVKLPDNELSILRNEKQKEEEKLVLAETGTTKKSIFGI